MIWHKKQLIIIMNNQLKANFKNNKNIFFKKNFFLIIKILFLINLVKKFIFFL